MTVMMMPLLTFAEGETVQDPIQDKSTDTATIYVGKEMKINQPGKFPPVNDFTFELTAERAWSSSNVSAGENGTIISAAEMPKPSANGKEHERVSTNGSVTTIDVGDFRGTADTNDKDSSTRKFRYTPVSISFQKPGYYVYRLTETAPDNPVAGMTYDDHSYFVVVYVCSNTDVNGNTEGGVYVHDITAYRNESGSNEYSPNLDDISAAADNGTNETGQNNASNLGKVGHSARTEGSDPGTGLNIGPNKLETFRFFNELTTHDLMITNTVKGNLGDVYKQFEYTVTMTGLEENRKYTTNQQAEGKTDTDITTAGSEIYEITGGKGTVDPELKTITADESGCATFGIKLKSGDSVVLNTLPAGATYKIEEHSSDHIASFKAESTASGTCRIETPEQSNTVKDKELSTALETVDRGANDDGTVTVTFTNHRDLVTPTGIPYHGDIQYVMAALLFIVGIFFAARLRRKHREEQ